MYEDPDEIEAFAEDKKQQALAINDMQAKRDNDQSSNTSELEFEPPLPAMHVPRKPNQEDSQGI